MKLWFDKSVGLFSIADWIIDFLDEFGHILVGWLIGLLIGWLGSQLFILNLGVTWCKLLDKI
jgi:small neutral amino acid transporter SnatA (MarC family)